MNGREIKAAAIQMSSTPNKGENLDTAESLIRSAASSGAGLIALPELWNCHGLEDVRPLSGGVPRPEKPPPRGIPLVGESAPQASYAGELRRSR
jgi:Carbon-nitrogen hydrolase